MDRLRTIAASYWTAVALGVVALALHVRWYVVDRPPGSEVVSGFGAALVAVTVFAIGSALLSPGALDRAAAGAMPQDYRTAWRGHDPEASPRRAALFAATRRGIVVERVVIGGVVLVGTLLNGYGPFIARVFGLRGA